MTRREFADDADHDHPWAKAYRIPLVSDYPAWKYEVALVHVGGGFSEGHHWAATTPSEEEARVVGSYIDFRRSYYGPHWAAEMLEHPFDVDSGTNTVVLLRTATGWAYRRASWTQGPPYVASPVPGADVSGLIALLDHVNDHSTTWGPWKADHSGVFATATEGANR